jgi:hypothetical protein
MKDEIIWITKASHLVLTFWCICKFSVFRKNILFVPSAPTPPPLFFHSIPSHTSLLFPLFLYYFLLSVRLSVCLLHPVCYSQKLQWKFYCCQMMWLLFFFLAFLLTGLRFQILETVNVLAWFNVQQCWRLAQCIRYYTHFIVVYFTASSDWYSERRSADTLWKYFWVY